MWLNRYHVGNYSPGASLLRQVLWFFVGSPLFYSTLVPSSTLKILILKVFGATIGQGVRIKPRVSVKFPWRLSIGEHSWIGEGVWIDNLAPVSIGSHTCISQGVYFCTGNHDWRAHNFVLDEKPITVGNHVWIAAKALLSPGVTAHIGSVLTLGSVAHHDLEPWSVYTGNPAVKVKDRPPTTKDSK